MSNPLSTLGLPIAIVQAELDRGNLTQLMKICRAQVSNLAKFVHPDKGYNETLMAELNTALRTLQDPGALPFFAKNLVSNAPMASEATVDESQNATSRYGALFFASFAGNFAQPTGPIRTEPRRYLVHALTRHDAYFMVDCHDGQLDVSVVFDEQVRNSYAEVIDQRASTASRLSQQFVILGSKTEENAATSYGVASSRMSLEGGEKPLILWQSPDITPWIEDISVTTPDVGEEIVVLSDDGKIADLGVVVYTY